MLNLQVIDGYTFGHVSFGTSVIQSDVEPLGYWRLDFGTPGS